MRFATVDVHGFRKNHTDQEWRRSVAVVQEVDSLLRHYVRIRIML